MLSKIHWVCPKYFVNPGRYRLTWRFGGISVFYLLSENTLLTKEANDYRE
jgi:hypothetical protein